MVNVQMKTLSDGSTESSPAEALKYRFIVSNGSGKPWIVSVPPSKAKKYYHAGFVDPVEFEITLSI